jgi:hypothetical protein
MRTHRIPTRSIAALLLAIVLSGCAAASAPAPAATSTLTAAPAPTTTPPLADPPGCDLTGSLSVSTWLGNHKVNDVGTKECDYLIWIRNTHKTETIVPVVLQQNMDAFQGSDDTKWEALPPIAPGERYEWQGYVYLINEARASVPMARIPKRMVGLRAAEACMALQAAPTTLAAHALTVDEPCSGDLLLWPEFLGD